VKDRPRAASVQICHPRGLVPTQVTLNFTNEPKPTSAWFAQIFIGMSFRQFASVFLLIITACESHDTGRSNINGSSHNRHTDANTCGHNRHGCICNC